MAGGDFTQAGGGGRQAYALAGRWRVWVDAVGEIFRQQRESQRRERRTEAFKSAIANGTFKINAEAIADKLLGNAQEMLDRVRS